MEDEEAGTNPLPTRERERQGALANSKTCSRAGIDAGQEPRLSACAYGIDRVSGTCAALSGFSRSAYHTGRAGTWGDFQISVVEPEVVSRSRVRIGYRTTKHERR